MSTRKIVVYSSATQRANDVMTDATTWGVLKSKLSMDGLLTGQMKAIIGQTKLTLDHVDAELPEGDFQLFLVPEKTKSGSGDVDAEALTLLLIRFLSL